MRTAESIIREYLERGYSLESLRVLAESRSEPLCSEMLASLKQMERIDAPDVPCETAAEEEVIFFVADEDPVEVEEIGVDFNVMTEPDPASDAGSPPADLEESIAEITIGETEGSDVVSYQPDAKGFPGSERVTAQGHGIWSRFWNGEKETPVETAQPEQAATDEPEVDILSEIGTDAETGEAEEPENAAASESSGDYLPGSIVVSDEETSRDAVAEENDLVPEPTEAPEECKDESVENTDTESSKEASPEEDAPFVVSDEAAAAESPAVDTAMTLVEQPTLPVPAPQKELNKKEARRERRKRERAEKKKQKLQAKNADASIKKTILPEIVLTRSEDTDTLVPEEQNEPVVSEAAPPHLAFPALDLHADAASEQAEAAESGKPEAKAVEENKGPLSDLTTDADKLVLPSPPAAEADPEDHAMIIATGGLDLRSDAYRLLQDESALADDGLRDYEPVHEEETGNNVILFRTHFVYHDEEKDEIEDEAPRFPMLRMLPLVENEEENEIADEPAAQEPVENAQAGEPAETAPMAEDAGLSPIDRLGLLRAFVGVADEPAAAPGDSGTIAESDHVIVKREPEPVDLLAEAEEAQNLIEAEYQARLDEFASRLLEVQTAAAENEKLLRERAEEIRNRESELDELAKQRAEQEEKAAKLASELEEAQGEISRKQVKLDEFKEVLGEHERLYNEFEDLRKAYNEVVVEVMPALQNERDDLALTVERKCEAEDRMRASLGSARRRLAVGYSLGAAACAMLIALPLFNWLRSGDDSRDLAMDHQKATELRDRLDKAEMRNVKYEKELFELERKAGLQLAELQERNRELSRLADQRTVELANAQSGKASSGTPTRTSSMIGPPAQGNGKLAHNEVRDPAGQIDQTVAMNRARRDSAPAAPIGENASRIAVSAVASTRPQSSGGTALRPPAASAATGTVPARAGARTEVASANQKPGETLAKVKAGEGVAQVVYRVLGTRDPEVINWVIRENNIKNDRRGNPRIYPDQELRLPQGGRTAQTASAARR